MYGTRFKGSVHILKYFYSFRKMRNYLFLIATFLYSIFMNAQGLIETTPAQIEFPYLVNPETQMNVLSENIGFGAPKALKVPSGNTIFIEQIGRENTGNVQAISNRSEINLLQRGNENTVRLELQGSTVDYEVLQNGNNNLLREYSAASAPSVIQREISQSGNGQNLIIHGSNGLTERMKIDMGQGSQSLVIRNLN